MGIQPLFLCAPSDSFPGSLAADQALLCGKAAQPLIHQDHGNPGCFAKLTPPGGCAARAGSGGAVHIKRNPNHHPLNPLALDDLTNLPLGIQGRRHNQDGMWGCKRPPSITQR